MENPPSIERETPDEPIKKTFEIKQGKEKYELITELSEDNIVLTILKEDLLFEKFEKN